MAVARLWVSCIEGVEGLVFAFVFVIGCLLLGDRVDAVGVGARQRQVAHHLKHRDNHGEEIGTVFGLVRHEGCEEIHGFVAQSANCFVRA